MALRRDLVDATRWIGDALDDGLDLHLQLVDEGVRVRFVPEAHVASAMPTEEAGSETQQHRWEAGKAQSLRRWVPRLIRHGIRDRDPARLHAAFDGLVPAQALLAALNVTGLAVAGLSGSPRLRRLALANVAGQAVFVIGGLRIAKAPPATYAALALAPALVARKLALYGRLATGAGGSWSNGHRA
jgi:hypothetical protein